MPQTRTTGSPAYPAGATSKPMPLSASRRLLVIMPSWVGDCVMAIPALRAVRRHLTDAGRPAEIAAYLRPALSPLFESGGLFDECIGGRPRGLLGPGREAGRLRAHEFDTALVLPNSFRAAWTAWLARIPRRIGYDRDQRGWLLTDRVPCPTPGGWSQPMPLVAYYLQLAAPFGIAMPPDASPRLAPAAPELARARGLLAAGGLTPGRPVALLNPGASKPGKRWPADRFAALADRLHDQRGMQVVLNGAPHERDLTRAVAGRIRRAAALDLAQHQTTLATLAALCSLVDLVVTNDTGTRHIAAAVGFEQLRHERPAPGIVTIFGTVPPEWTALGYPKESELYDRAAGRVDAIGLEQVAETCGEALAGRR